MSEWVRRASTSALTSQPSSVRCSSILVLVLALSLPARAQSSAAADAAPSPALLRAALIETALAQRKSIDPRWNKDQRDCAGFVRFAYREAYRRLAPARLAQGLWLDQAGRRTAFADAETLVSAGSFVLLGRDAATRGGLESGDVVAFRQMRADDEPPEYHLMLVVQHEDPGRFGPWVIYHPGDGKDAVRLGPLAGLTREAPLEWRPEETNPSFLGYFRYKEWIHD